MKFNWGHGITVFFVIFVSLMLTALFVSRTKNIDLVTEDYYSAELKYQDHLDCIQRSNEKGFKLEASEVDNFLVIQFPIELVRSKELEGQVHIYRPSNAALDILEPLSVDSIGRMHIPRIRLHQGIYTIKVDFSLNKVNYYLEKELRI